MTMLLIFLAGVALFEAGFFAYRRWRDARNSDGQFP
jgi:hypothetical protein